MFRPGEPDANESAVARAVAEWFREEGFVVRMQEAAPGRPNVIAWIQVDEYVEVTELAQATCCYAAAAARFLGAVA